MENSLIQEFPLKWKSTAENLGHDFHLIKWLSQEGGTPTLVLVDSAVSAWPADSDAERMERTCVNYRWKVSSLPEAGAERGAIYAESSQMFLVYQASCLLILSWKCISNEELLPNISSFLETKQ